MSKSQKQRAEELDALVASMPESDVLTDGPAPSELPDGEQDAVENVVLAGTLTKADTTLTLVSSSVRTVRGAVEWGKGQVERGVAIYHGLCLMFVRLCLGVDPLAPSAKVAWLQADHKHPSKDVDSWPRGHAGFMRGGEFWHIVLVLGNGWCLSTDAVEWGKVSRVRIQQLADKWGYEVLGWTDDLNGEHPAPAARPRKPHMSQRDFKVKWLRRAIVRARAAGDHDSAARLRRWLDTVRGTK